MANPPISSGTPASAQVLHLIGFGSQASAWAQCVRASGWRTQVYLSRPEGPSAQKARAQGFEPRPLSALQGLEDLARPGIRSSEASAAPLVAMLCPDTEIGPVYREHLSRLPSPLTLVLAHGYAVYAGDLVPQRPEHQVALFAPKAIGPKIWALFQEARARGESHRLVAGFSASAEREPDLRELARAMGFSPERLARATFEQEAVGDLLSEQGLLCGGVFTLLEWTIDAMNRAGVPPALIREECLTELELIAGLLRERGPATTFSAISQAAQCGAVAMRERLQASGARAHFDALLDEVLDRRFVERFRSDRWRDQARELLGRLEGFEQQLNAASAGSKEGESR